MKIMYSLLVLLFLTATPSLIFSAEILSQEYINSKMDFKRIVSFSIPFEDAKEVFKKYYPELETDEEILNFIKERKIQHIVTDDGIFLFSEFEGNLFFRDPVIAGKSSEWQEYRRNIVRYFLDEYYRTTNPMGGAKEVLEPFYRPREIFVEYSIDVPREELPDSGYLKLWIPLPIQTPSQRNISIIDIEPKTALIGTPSTYGDLGYAFFKLDLSFLQENLKLNIKYSYTRYEQEFYIEETQVGDYDQESYIYKEFTKSSGNIFYNEEIRETAAIIAGDQTNPYHIARSIYGYVIDNIKYSLMAHAYFEAMGIPESLYVFKNGYGDCGSQSIFFSALCRSIGIPARTTGGFQLFGDTLGDHFWAEFYLPNYGWIPVDTSAAQIADYASEISDEENENFKECFFAKLDPLRLTVQNNVDVFPDEKPNDIQILSMVLQMPFVESEYGDEWYNVTLTIIGNVKINLRLVN